MNENIKSCIKDNEVLLWSGQPEPFEVMDKTNKGAIIKSIIIYWAVAIIVSAAHIISATGNGLEPKYVVVIALVALAAAFSYNAISRAKKVAHIIYAVTDKRMFSKIEGHHELSEVKFESVKDAAFAVDNDGHTSLLCGSAAVKAAPSKFRSLANKAARISEKKECEAYVMYAIPDAEEVKKIIKDYLPMIK